MKNLILVLIAVATLVMSGCAGISRVDVNSASHEYELYAEGAELLNSNSNIDSEKLSKKVLNADQLVAQEMKILQDLISRVTTEGKVDMYVQLPGSYGYINAVEQEFSNEEPVIHDSLMAAAGITGQLKSFKRVSLKENIDGEERSVDIELFENESISEIEMGSTTVRIKSDSKEIYYSIDPEDSSTYLQIETFDDKKNELANITIGTRNDTLWYSDYDFPERIEGKYAILEKRIGFSTYNPKPSINCYINVFDKNSQDKAYENLYQSWKSRKEIMNSKSYMSESYNDQSSTIFQYDGYNCISANTVYTRNDTLVRYYNKTAEYGEFSKKTIHQTEDIPNSSLYIYTETEEYDPDCGSASEIHEYDFDGDSLVDSTIVYQKKMTSDKEFFYTESKIKNDILLSRIKISLKKAENYSDYWQTQSVEFDIDGDGAYEDNLVWENYYTFFGNHIETSMFRCEGWEESKNWKEAQKD